MPHEETVLFEQAGSVGQVILNRPCALNALTHDMVRGIGAQLQRWSTDPQVRIVILRGAGDRGFCGGADVRAIFEDAVAGGSSTRDFWFDELRLDALIARYQKPVLALMDGLVMGAGIGLGAHTQFRVVTERTTISFPETGLGLVPDCGSSWLLARAPGQLGLHAALTGQRLTAADALELGLADRQINAADLEELISQVHQIPDTADAAAAVTGILARLAEDASREASALARAREWIDRCYAAQSVEEILDRLGASEWPEAAKAIGKIGQGAAMSTKLCLEALRRARSMDRLEQAMEQEFDLLLRCFERQDLIEGIRCRVLERGQQPSWEPASLDQVSQTMVEEFFQETRWRKRLWVETAL